MSILSCWQKFSQARVVLSDLDHLVHIQDFIALAFMADFLIDFARNPSVTAGTEAITL